MTTQDDGRALERVAGVSLAAPRASYQVDDPRFGTATLARDHWAVSALAQITLSLTEAVADACAAKGDSGAREVVMSMYDWCGGSGEALREDDARLASLRALLVERALLSHPEGLQRQDLAGVDGQSPEGELLAVLASHRADVTRGPRLSERECQTCQTERAANERKRADEARAELMRKVSAAKSPREAARIQHEYSAALYPSSRFEYGYGRRRSRPADRGDCAHIALVAQAMALFCERFPELAFELLGLLVTARYESARFVLGAVMTRVVVPRWLVGRVRSRYEDSWRWYGRGAPRAPSRWTGIRDRARAARDLPAEQRAAVSYAATAWSYDAPLGALGWSPAENDGDDQSPPSLRDDADDRRVEVERVLPAFALKGSKPATKAIEETAAKVTTVKATAVKGTATKATGPRARKAEAPPKARASKAAAPARADFEAARAILRSIGIPDDVIEEMEREGRLVTPVKRRR